MASARRLAVIMFTDMVGYTPTVHSDETQGLKLLREQEDLVRPILSSHRGREIKSTGDGFLVEFDSALNAIQCAISVQQHLVERNDRIGVQPIRLRIGIHLGDVEERGNDVFGDAVNIASRIQPLAVPGGICVTGEVYNQIRNKLPNRFEKLHSTILKGISTPVDVYRVFLPWEAPSTPPAFSGRNRLAVLPLANISPDPTDEYFADGLTEELISALSKIRELRVIARTSVAQYKSTSKSVSQIGTELDVSSVLEGSVRKSGHRLRITLQLIDVVTQEHIWANTYERDLDDVFLVQSDVAEKTAGALRVELVGAERESIHKKPTSNLAAYNLYLRGIFEMRQAKPGYQSLTNSMKFFEGAIEMDPKFAVAYATLANIYIGLSGDKLPHREVLPKAEKLVQTALALDPFSSEAHTARGNLAFQQEHDWPLAEREFRTAIALNPSNVLAHYWYSWLLRTLRRTGDQIEELRTTIELDPLWENPRTSLEIALALAGDTASSISSMKERCERHPQDPLPRLALGFLYYYSGRKEEARTLAEQLSGPLQDDVQLSLAVLWGLLGRPEPARSLAAKMEAEWESSHVGGTFVAELYAAIGEKGKALDLLEREDQLGESSLWFHYTLLPFDSIRDDPRFVALLKKQQLA